MLGCDSCLRSSTSDSRPLRCSCAFSIVFPLKSTWREWRMGVSSRSRRQAHDREPSCTFYAPRVEDAHLLHCKEFICVLIQTDVHAAESSDANQLPFLPPHRRPRLRKVIVGGAPSRRPSAVSVPPLGALAALRAVSRRSRRLCSWNGWRPVAVGTVRSNLGRSPASRRRGRNAGPRRQRLRSAVLERLLRSRNILEVAALDGLSGRALLRHAEPGSHASAPVACGPAASKRCTSRCAFGGAVPDEMLNSKKK